MLLLHRTAFQQRERVGSRGRDSRRASPDRPSRSARPHRNWSPDQTQVIEGQLARRLPPVGRCHPSRTPPTCGTGDWGAGPPRCRHDPVVERRCQRGLIWNTISAVSAPALTMRCRWPRRTMANLWSAGLTTTPSTRSRPRRAPDNRTCPSTGCISPPELAGLQADRAHRSPRWQRRGAEQDPHLATNPVDAGQSVAATFAATVACRYMVIPSLDGTQNSKSVGSSSPVAGRSPPRPGPGCRRRRVSPPRRSRPTSAPAEVRRRVQCR